MRSRAALPIRNVEDPSVALSICYIYRIAEKHHPPSCTQNSGRVNALSLSRAIEPLLGYREIRRRSDGRLEAASVVEGVAQRRYLPRCEGILIYYHGYIRRKLLIRRYAASSNAPCVASARLAMLSQSRGRTATRFHSINRRPSTSSFYPSRGKLRATSPSISPFPSGLTLRHSSFQCFMPCGLAELEPYTAMLLPQSAGLLYIYDKIPRRPPHIKSPEIGTHARAIVTAEQKPILYG